MLHAHFIKSGFEPDVFASTALLDMYAKLGTFEHARHVFDEMHVREIPTWNAMMKGHARFGDMEGALELFRLMRSRNVVSWTTMISGYSQNKQYEKALGLFLRMEGEKGIMPNEVTLASILPACANLGALEIGQRVEAYARKNGFFRNLFVSNAVLEMYAKCGKIDVAWRVFGEIGSLRNLWSWNSMIMGLAVHGQCGKALELYDQMLVSCLPDLFLNSFTDIMINPFLAVILNLKDTNIDVSLMVPERRNFTERCDIRGAPIGMHPWRHG